MSCSFGVVKGGWWGVWPEDVLHLWFSSTSTEQPQQNLMDLPYYLIKWGHSYHHLWFFFPISCPYGFLFDTREETMSHCARVIPKACFINCVHCSRLEHMNMKCFVCANWNPCVTWSKEISLSFTWVCTNLCTHAHEDMAQVPAFLVNSFASWHGNILQAYLKLRIMWHAAAILHSHISPQLC